MISSESLTCLALTLVSATSVEELLARAPAALAAALDPLCAFRIDLANGVDRSPRVEGECLDLPLVAEGRRLGRLVAECPAEGPCRLDPEALEVVGELLAGALASRQRAAREQAELLKEAAELKFDTVSMLSHEMRTPLASIKGYATALLLDEADWNAGERSAFLQAIDEESDRLTALIEEILESAAIDAGALQLELEPILIQRIAARVVDRMMIRSSLHRFVLTFPPEFPVIVADAQRVEQVLTNLLDNAVKYSPDGGLVVVRGEVQRDEVVVSVSDQGIGIAPEDLNKLFERFFRASSKRRERVVGTGLGLPISDSIVRAHGGRIWAESTVGRGTTLSFSLPRRGPGGDE